MERTSGESGRTYGSIMASSPSNAGTIIGHTSFASSTPLAVSKARALAALATWALDVAHFVLHHDRMCGVALAAVALSPTTASPPTTHHPPFRPVQWQKSDYANGYTEFLGIEYKGEKCLQVNRAH